MILRIAALTAVVSLTACTSPSPDTAINACLMSRQFVTQALRAPASAEFSPCEPKAVAVKNKDGWWRVSGYVDSQNGFGAHIRNNYTIAVRVGKDTGEWEARDLSMGE